MSWLSNVLRRNRPLTVLLSRPLITEIAGKVRQLVARESGNPHLAKLMADEITAYLERKLRP